MILRPWNSPPTGPSRRLRLRYCNPQEEVQPQTNGVLFFPTPEVCPPHEFLCHDRSTRQLAYAELEADGKDGGRGCRRQKRATGGRRGPSDEMPDAYWQVVLNDGSADRGRPGPSIRT